MTVITTLAGICWCFGVVWFLQWRNTENTDSRYYSYCNLSGVFFIYSKYMGLVYLVSDSHICRYLQKPWLSRLFSLLLLVTICLYASSGFWPFSVCPACSVWNTLQPRDTWPCTADPIQKDFAASYPHVPTLSNAKQFVTDKSIHLPQILLQSSKISERLCLTSACVGSDLQSLVFKGIQGASGDWKHLVDFSSVIKHEPSPRWFTKNSCSCVVTSSMDYYMLNPWC